MARPLRQERQRLNRSNSLERVLETSGPSRFQRILSALWPRPDCGNYLLDLAHLLMLAAIEQSVIPYNVLGVFRIDLITPWLLVTFVLAPLRKTLPLAIIAGVIQETRSTAPAGLYISAYWSAAIALSYIRHTLSWRHTGPWAVTIVCGMTWVAAFETLVIALTQDPGRIGIRYVTEQLLRIVIATAIGVTLSQTSRLNLPPEEQTG
jgi:hypothetical protein